MSHLRLYKNTLRLGLLVMLMVALLGVLGAAQPTLAAQDATLRIVRNDGALFDITSSDLAFSASNAVTIAPESMVNTQVGTKNLKPLGNPSAESVIGPDGRTQVTNTTAYPNSAIAHLEVDFPGASGTCTGWFISPNRLATAGHCVYDGALGWATAITVYPGRNGGTAPWGPYAAINWYTNTGWTGTQNPKYDYAVIKLGSNVGNTVGWFGYGWTSDNSFLLNHKSNVRGYPGDKAYGTLWTMAGKIQTVQKTRLFYSIDTFGGQSGSPHYGKWNASCNPCSFGIHTYGVGDGWTKNSSTRITKGVFNFLQNAGTP